MGIVFFCIPSDNSLRYLALGFDAHRSHTVVSQALAPATPGSKGSVERLQCHRRSTDECENVDFKRVIYIKREAAADVEKQA